MPRPASQTAPSRARATSLLAVRLLGAGAVLTLALLAVETLLVVRMYRAFHDLTTSEVRLQELRGEVQYLDEVLTNAARLSAATGDLVWRLRYDEAQPRLERLLGEMIALAQDPFEEAAGRRIDEANRRLVAMELESFRLVREGRSDEALALLSGGQYQRNKEIYAEGMHEGAEAISTRLAALRTEYGQRVVAVLVLTVLSLIFLIAAWIGAIAMVRRHFAALADAADAASLQRIVFDSTQDCIVLSDEDGRVVAVNPAVAHVLGYAPGTLEGRPLSETIFPAEFRERFGPVVRALLESSGGVPRELAVRAADGTEVPVEGTVSRTRMGDGRMLSTAVLRDIRERREAEARRAQLETELRHAQKMEALGTLAGGIAHDFNNLLAAMTGFAENARATLPHDHPARRALARLDEAMGHAAGMTRSLLTFCRKAPAERVEVDLRRVVEQTLRLVEPLLPKRIAIEKDLPAGPGPWVRGDAAQLQQVLMNLCLNARDAMPSGGTLGVALSAETTGESPGLVRLAVRDTGSGMSEATQRRIFEPFFTTKAPGSGTGLGLAVLHGIVTDHGGTVEVESRPGRGTWFAVTLPAVEPPAPPEAAPRSLGVVLRLQDPYARSIVRSALRRAGHTIAERGGDVVITDQPPAPGESGSASLPTVLLGDTVSAHAPPGTVVVRTPFRVAALVRAIEEACSSASESPEPADAGGQAREV